MTRDEAMMEYVIPAIVRMWNDDTCDEILGALKQGPYDDAISREDALMALTGEWTESRAEILPKAIRRIKALPSVNPQEPKKGHWITKIKSDLYGDMWPTNPKCSECGGEPYYVNTIYNYKFCPYCGAKMAESEE